MEPSTINGGVLRSGGASKPGGRETDKLEGARMWMSRALRAPTLGDAADSGVSENILALAPPLLNSNIASGSSPWMMARKGTPP
jgi:hypothetical protein